MSLIFEDGQRHDEVRSCLRIPSFDEFDVKAYRVSCGFSQSQFAKIHGVNIYTLRRWENSKNAPRLSDSFSSILNAWVAMKMQQNLPTSK